MPVEGQASPGVLVDLVYLNWEVGLDPLYLRDALFGASPHYMQLSKLTFC